MKASHCHSELGAEILELAFAMPILLFCFLAASQIIIWGFSTTQLASAAESTANQIDLVELIDTGTQTQEAKDMVSSDIASRMLNVSASDITISDLEIQATQSSTNSEGASSTSAGTSLAYRTVQSTGTISFNVSYICPSIINIGPPLVITHTWQRDRLMSRVAEVS